MDIVLSTLHRSSQPLLEVADALRGEDGAPNRIQVHVSPEHLCVSDPEALSATQAALRRCGLIVDSVHAPSGAAADISAGPAQNRRETYQQHLCSLEAARVLGCDLVIVHPGHRWQEERERNVRLMRAMAMLQDLTTAAERLKVRIALENLPPGMVGARPEDMVNLVGLADSPAVGFCLDTGHALLTEVPLGEWISYFAGRLFSIDWHVNGGDADEHLPPTSGSVDWEPFFADLRAVGYHGDLVLELCQPSGADLQQAVQQAAALARRGGRRQY